MTEPDIIHSNRPQQVSIPEGSHVAVSKTGTPQEPSVHKNYRAGGGEEIPPDIPDRMSPAPQEDRAHRTTPGEGLHAPERTDLAKTPLSHQGDARGMVASSPVPHETTSSSTAPQAPSSPIAPSALEAKSVQVSADASDSKDVNALPEGLAMPEMDFPARVVHLRIENEQLRTRLEKLDADR